MNGHTSRYEALSGAIRLMEALEHINVEGSRETLQDIAKDVRYGGEWKGDYEKIAGSLNRCEKKECYICQYKDHGTCKQALKHDAAQAIRQLEKDKKDIEQAANEAIAEKLNYIEELNGRIEELEEQIAIMSECKPAEGQTAEEHREPAQWQRELMENPDIAKAGDVLPF